MMNFGKRSLSAVLAALLLFALLPISALTAFAEETENGFTYVESYGTAFLTGTDETVTGDVVIPERLGGMEVSAIGASAFQDRADIISVTIPNTVERICDHAFSACTSLAEVTIPDSVKELDRFAFGSCTSLVRVNIGQGLEIFDVYDDYSAFTGCSALEEIHVSGENKTFASEDGVLFSKDKKTLIDYPEGKRDASYTIPAGVSEIREQAFTNANRLNTVSISSDVKTIGDYAFARANLTSVVFSEGVEEIGAYAFNNCGSLVEISFPDSLTSIGDYALASCSSLETVSLGAGLKTIGEGLFYSYSRLSLVEINVASKNAHFSAVDGVLFSKDGKTLYVYPVAKEETTYTVPAGTERLEQYAFFNAENLQSVVLPEGLKSIGSYAFEFSDLDFPTIPSTLEEVGNYAFDDRSTWFESFADGVVYLGRVAYMYKGETPADCEIVIREGTVSVSPYAFYSQNSLVSVTLPSSLKQIGEGAFADIPSLREVRGGAGLVEIGEEAFWCCTSLSAFPFSDTIEEIGKGAFYSCRALSEITIPSKLEVLEYEVFSFCTGLEEIVIPDNVKVIRDYAFYNCDGIRSITVGSGLEEVEAFTAFGQCSPTSITLGTVKEEIAPVWHCGYNSCETLTISEGVTEIYELAFSSFDSLETVVLPNTLKVIGDAAFQYCDGLREIRIPESVETIGCDAFFYCNNLAEIQMPETDILIDYYAFHNTAWYDAQPDGVVYLGRVAYYHKWNDEGEGTLAIREGTLSISPNAMEDWTVSEYTELVLPKSLKKIGDSAFCGLQQLWSVSIDPDNETFFVDEMGALMTKDQKTFILFPAGFNCGAYQMPDGVTAIAPYAFASNVSLTAVGLPDSLETIGESAFERTAITRAEIPAGVSVIPECAFMSCSDLAKVTFEGSITEIGGGGAFEYCTRLSEISLPEGLETIGNNAFNNCRAIEEITLPESLTELGAYVFQGCDALQSIHIPEKVDPNLDGGWYAFEGCMALKSITVDADNRALTAVDGVLYTKDLSRLVQYPAAKADQFFDVPASVETISGGSFGRVQNLRHLNVGKDVRFDYAELGGSLEHVCYEGNRLRWENYSAQSLELSENVTVHFESDDDVFEENTRAADCFTSGGVYVECTLCGFECCAEETSESLGHVLDGTVCTECDTDLLSYLQTAHPYSTNMNQTWEVKLRGAECFNVTFSEETFTEYCDWIELYDAEGEQIGRYSRNALAGETINVYSDTLKIKMTSDGSVEYYGFAVTDIALGADVPEISTTHKVYFYDFDGNLYNCVSVNHGESVLPPVAPYVPGYEFLGWDTDLDCVTEELYVYPLYRRSLRIVSYGYVDEVNLGETASIFVEALGEGLTYKWYYKDKGMSSFKLTTSFTGDTYSVAMTAARSGRQVYCVITDVYGNSITSEVFTLKQKLRITAQPQDVLTTYNKTAKATVSAEGEGLTYKWYYKDKGMSSFKLTTSFKGASYSVAMTAARSGREVYCVITDAYGNSITSEVVTLKMKASIVTQPKSVQVAKGKTAKVTVSAEGEGLTYKWYYKDKGMSSFKLTTSFKGASYSVAMSAARSGRQVYCVITDADGNSVTSKVVTLSMKARIATQPKSVAVAKNKTAKVTVKAEGEGLKYTWYVKKAGASKFSKSSVKTSSYSAKMTSSSTNRQLYCKVTDKFGNTVTTKTVSMKLK